MRIPNTIATSARAASVAASAGLMPGSKSISAPGSSRASSSTGEDGRTNRLRIEPITPGPPSGTSAAYPPGGITALEPVPVTTPNCAYPPITAIRAGSVSGRTPSFLSSTMPCRAVSSATPGSGAGGASSHASTPIA